MKKRLIADFYRSFHELTHAKGRSFLTLLSVLIGTTTVVSLIQFGLLAEHAAVAGFKTLGTNRMTIAIRREKPNDLSHTVYTTSEYHRIQPHLLSEHIQHWSPYISSFKNITLNGKNIDAQLIGADDDFYQSLNIHESRGRLFTEFDTQTKFCMLGDRFFQKIQAQLGETDPIGMRLHIGNDIFQVIGIMNPIPHNVLFYQDLNDAVFIPLQAAITLTGTLPREFMISIDEDDFVRKSSEEIKQGIQSLFPQLRVEIHSSEEIIAQIHEQTHIYTLLLGAIGSLSLLVGGLGVMNILLMSVMHRKEEIGIRKAVGATRFDILWQFLSEALILTTSGSGLGVVFSFICAAIVAHIAHWEWVWFWFPVWIGLLLGIGLGLFFGFFPAFRASRLDPILLLKTH